MNVQVCFPAGTPVVMADGTTRTIENILPGDEVKAVAHQSPNGEIVTGRVVRIFRNAPQMLCHLHFGTFEIRATKEHPFYVKDKGWVAAEYLKVGDVCRSASGNDVVLLYKDYESEEVPVFNFEVEGWHTYFVGENAKQSVLVHNACTNLSCGHSSCEWQRHLYEIGCGLQTSGRSFANGISGAVVSVTTLNFYAYDGPFEMNDWDKCYGGKTSQVIIQGSAELGFAAVTGVTASVAKSSPKVLRYGANAVNAFDAAGNAVGVGQSASHIIETGEVSLQDGVQLVGSGLGLAGNSLPVLKSIPTKIPKLGDDINVTPNIADKLQYVFGKATGQKHNIDRSVAMLHELERIGLFDTPANRQYLTELLKKAYHETTNIKESVDGKIIKETLVMGPNGGVIMESVWKGENLISVTIYGGKR